MSFAPRIRVDFNRKSAGNVVASAQRATAPLQVGEVVVAYQPGENMEHFARVVEARSDSPRVLLEVDWTSDPSVWVPAAAGWSTAGFTALVPSTPGNLFYRTSSVVTRPALAAGRSTQPVTVGTRS